MERHLILGAITTESHIQNYQFRHPNVNVICLCRSLDLEHYEDCKQDTKVESSSSKNSILTTDWKEDFNHPKFWKEIGDTYGSRSFTKIIFDSSTCKFMCHNFWDIDSGHFDLVTRLLTGNGHIYFDSFNLGSVCIPETMLNDLASTGYTTGFLRFLPLDRENKVHVTRTLTDLSNNQSWDWMERQISQSREFRLFLDKLNRKVDRGNFTLAEAQRIPYPLQNTNYTVNYYLIYTSV